MNLIIIGPSGSGKGTQADLLAKKLQIPSLSMGEILRKAYEDKTPDGIEAEKTWGIGKWSPPALVFKILVAVLDQCPNGFILDGYPRLEEQISLLENYLKTKNQKINRVIQLCVSDQESTKRLLSRAESDRKTKGQARKDETVESIQSRLREYHRTIEPILQNFQKKGLLLQIDGERSIKAIHQDIVEKLENVQ
ncbi:MAG: nucleoside monophosphate kinase [Candidatus Shapirobacteria bacterium]